MRSWLRSERRRELRSWRFRCRESPAKGLIARGLSLKSVLLLRSFAAPRATCALSSGARRCFDDVSHDDSSRVGTGFGAQGCASGYRYTGTASVPGARCSKLSARIVQSAAACRFCRQGAHLRRRRAAAASTNRARPAAVEQATTGVAGARQLVHRRVGGELVDAAVGAAGACGSAGSPRVQGNRIVANGSSSGFPITTSFSFDEGNKIARIDITLWCGRCRTDLFGRTA